MMLQPGHSVSGLETHSTFSVDDFLAVGGQAEIYKLSGPGEPSVLKWYKPQFATEEQRKNLLDLVRRGAPRGCEREFAWPIEMMVKSGNNPGSGEFGYRMPLIDRARFRELGEIQSSVLRGKQQRLSLSSLATVSANVARCYLSLHLSGLCYRDISRHNILIDAETSAVMICDNDNIGIDGHSKSAVAGTIDYMAPEVLRGRPSSSEADFHSLAVLLFLIWMWHSPFEGTQWDRLAPMTKTAYRDFLSRASFIFDDGDRSNHLPADSDFDGVRRNWENCPTRLRKLFGRTFGAGLRYSSRRVTDGEWLAASTQVADLVFQCKCRAEFSADSGDTPKSCWNCGAHPVVPLIFQATHPSGRASKTLLLGTKLLARHLNPSLSGPVASQVVGEVLADPSNRKQWGIRNLTSTPWQKITQEGQIISVHPGSAVVLREGVRLTINTSQVIIS